MKKNICKVLLLVMLVAALAGCNWAGSETQAPVLQSGTKETTTVPTTVPTTVSTTVSTTVPTTVPTVAPSTVPSSDATQPTAGTSVPSTELTTVPSTVPTVPDHVHDWAVIKTVDATCTAGGYVIKQCSGCGNTMQTNTANSLGHKYGEYVSDNNATCVKDGTKTATCERCKKSNKKTDVGSKAKAAHDYQFVKLYLASPWTDGCDLYKCTVCRKEDERNVIHLDEEAAAAWLREAEAATLKYLNQYRAEIGSPEMTMLPGLSEVMRYRAHQWYLNGFNHAHDPDETTEAFTAFKYGDYYSKEYKESMKEELAQMGIDVSNVSTDPHYEPYGAEAAAYVGGIANTPDAFGYEIATLLCVYHPEHWHYLKLAEWTYAGVGIEYNEGYGVSAYIYTTDRDYDAISANN